MAELNVEVMGTASPTPSDHKRKHEDLDSTDAPEPPQLTTNEEEEEQDDSEAKRPRLDDQSVLENGCQENKVDEIKEVGAQPTVEDKNTAVEDTLGTAEVSLNKVNDEQLATNQQDGGIRQPSLEDLQAGIHGDTPSVGEHMAQSEDNQNTVADVSQEGNVSVAEQQDPSDTKTMSRKIEVPNTKVGVLIGKAGDTIRFLQFNSGARIQITRDADADPYAATRPVELIGTLEKINMAEKLIKDVIAEADAGGSPSLVARGFSTVQATGAREQIELLVPNEKVGVIIGRGGETIKSLQTRSGARIQLIPQHLPEGEQSKERTVRVTGDKKQIEMAREMIKEVMDQPVRPSPSSGGYNNQHANRTPLSASTQLGPRPYPARQTGYDYQQQVPYQSQYQQYPQQPYGNYPSQQLTPRSNIGWEQRPPAATQGPPRGGYDYYGRQGSHVANASNPIQSYAPGPSPAMGLPPSQPNYNYGPQGSDYGQAAPYSQTGAPPAQSYAHGYNEPKYENQVGVQHPFGGNSASQPSAYPQATTHPGYGMQEQYGKSPSYVMPPQGSHSQTYGQPRASQPGVLQYQGPVSSTQSYGQTAYAQQPYPTASGGQMQQNYLPYGSAPADGYTHTAPAVATAPNYPQQGVPPVTGYGQPGGQQAAGYTQVGPTGGYGQYPSTQPGYNEQAAPNGAAYGYQGTGDPAYGAAPVIGYGAAPSGQPTYAQVAPTQPPYDQSISQPGGYAT